MIREPCQRNQDIAAIADVAIRDIETLIAHDPSAKPAVLAGVVARLLQRFSDPKLDRLLQGALFVGRAER